MTRSENDGSGVDADSRRHETGDNAGDRQFTRPRMSSVFYQWFGTEHCLNDMYSLPANYSPQTDITQLRNSAFITASVTVNCVQC